MKMPVLRYLVLPWFLLFSAIITTIVLIGTKYGFHEKFQNYYIYALGVGIFFCLYANLKTLSKAGIWIAHSLPTSLRRSPWGWILRAILVGLVAFGFYMIGQLPSIPLIWHAAVIPAIFTICLFVGVWSLMGPILTWCSQVAFSRFSAFISSLPIFALVPITAIFLGQMILTAYQASRPEPLPFIVEAETAAKEEAAAAAAVTTPPEEVTTAETEIPAKSEDAVYFQELAKSGKACGDDTKKIQTALVPTGAEDTVFWAVKATKCADIKSVVALPKLVEIMMSHKNAKVRAAAIRAMPKYGTEDVKRINYLLVKRISEKEPNEVIEAASVVMSRLGEDEVKYATTRLKVLLDNPRTSGIAGKVLVHNLKRDDLVSEYVATHLPEKNEARNRAISMICALPEKSRATAEPYIGDMVAAIKTGEKNDPAIEALACMGQNGFRAIRQEVTNPQHLEKEVAARALAEMDLHDSQEALETASHCVRDKDEDVRQWCSQTLGRIGASALPQILDLLKSSDSDLKKAGTNALNFFEDPNAKDELLKLRAQNSGWMATKQKLQIAKAIDTALIKILSEESQQH